MTPEDFQAQVLDWFDRHGRKDLPWQVERTHYQVWVSEIMLQQTQVATVIPYYLKFMARFPTVASLAQASLGDVIAHWAGLGYYARARHLHQAAIQLQTRHQGQFPGDLALLEALPGVGRSTAGAVMSLGLGQRAAILDGNVKRVLCRLAGIAGWPGEAATLRQLWALSERLTPTERVADYNQAMMDLGALVCTRRRPACVDCPVSMDCSARRNGSTQSIPAPKPRRNRPVRTCYLLLLTNPARQVFLETRPPAGIWGGLQSLPEFAAMDDLRFWCLQRGISAENLQTLPERRHTFSHYHLDFTPVQLQAAGFDGVHESRSFGWFHPDQIQGLPAPVKTLITELFNPP